MTKGNIVNENNILDPGISYLTVRIEIARPNIKLVQTTARNRNIVLLSRVKTFQDCKKLDRFLEKLANLQNI